jgi:hypothetical protein
MPLLEFSAKQKTILLAKGVNMPERQYYFLSSGGQYAGMTVKFQ